MEQIFKVNDKVLLRDGRAPYVSEPGTNLVMVCPQDCSVVSVRPADQEHAKYHSQMIEIWLPEGYEPRTIMVSGSDLLKIEELGGL